MAAFLNEQVIAPDLTSETRWAAYGWWPMAMAHGLQACWSTPISSAAGKVLGAFAIYYSEPRAPNSCHQILIDRLANIARIAIEGALSETALRRSEAFFAEAQQISRTGSFSWRPATGEITWSGELYRIFELGRSWTRDQNGRLEYIGAVQDVTQRRLSAETLGKVRSELAHVARVTSLGAMTASIAHELNQPLSGIITNASTCLRMLAADPPNLDGARETARRTISRWQSCL